MQPEEAECIVGAVWRWHEGCLGVSVVEVVVSVWSSCKSDMGDAEQDSKSK